MADGNDIIAPNLMQGEDPRHTTDPSLDAPIDYSQQPELVQTEQQRVVTGAPDRVSRGQEQIDNANLAAKAGDLSLFGATAAAFTSGDNNAVQIYYDLNRIEKSGPDDPAWKAGGYKAWLDQRSKVIPAEQQWRYTQTNNPAEAQAMFQQSVDNAKQQQLLQARAEGGTGSMFSTFVARGLAGLVDWDAPLAVLSGGIGAGAKLGINATRMGRLLSGAASGAIMNSATVAGGYYSDPNSDWTSVPVAGLMGLGLGAVGGVLARSSHMAEKVSEPANEALGRTINEFDSTIKEDFPQAKQDVRTEMHGNDDVYASKWEQSEMQRAVDEQIAADKASPAPKAAEPTTKPEAFDISEVSRPEDTEGAFVPHGPSSVGAAQLGQTGPGIASIKSQKVVTMVQNAKTWLASSGILPEYFGNNSHLAQVADPLARGVQRFQDVIAATPLGTDFDRLMKSGSSVAQKLAYDIFENASGKLRNNRTASMLQEHYQKHVLGDFLPYHDAFEEYAGSQGAGAWQRIWNNQLRQDFDQHVIKELQGRMYDPQGTVRNVHPAVAKAADAIDKTFERELEVGKGRPGETPWKGYENLQAQSGYFPQKWSGGKMLRLRSRGAQWQDDIINAVTEHYRVQHPLMKPADAKVWASAVVNRALRQDDGLTTNLVSVLASDGRGMLEQTLKANGLAQNEIDRLIDGLTGSMAEKGAPGHTKQRIDVDMRYVASNGIAMMDLFDTDINKIVAQRARRTAGQGALARKGITSRADWEDIKEAIIHEQTANGPTAAPTGGLLDKANDLIDKDKHVDAQFMDDLYTYFSGTAIGGGISPMYSRIRKLTNLSLLNQLGITQLAEFGPTIGAVGWKRFMEHAGEAFQVRLGAPDSPLVKELQHFNIFVPEERMFRDDLTFAYEKANPNSSEYMQRFDNILNKAQRLQGYTSGFYEVRKIQQRVALTTATDNIMRTLKTGAGMSLDRFRDIGMDPQLMARVKQYVDNGTVQFQGDTIKKLNLDKWSPEDVEDFTLALNRSTNQFVQKGMAGESSILFHKDGVASLFFHLKSFPMLSLEKQFARNAQMADQTALNAFTYGLATAAAAYAAKQAINLQGDNLSAKKIALGALGNSNMTGWIPMWSDPIAGLLGMDSLQIGGGKYGANSIISMPASLTTMDKLLQAPQAAAKFVNPFVHMSNGDINALRTIPIFGNLYGVNALLNSLKQ